ncbi:hypothetical protein M0R36_08810 [bacterium]|jgi:hypothetical protein|nr:hypothetical protein [bacterium]
MNLGKKILANLIDKSYVKGRGFSFFYDRTDPLNRGYINTNDLGDYIPFLHYFGFGDIVRDCLGSVLSRYDVFYRERVERFGSTRLSKFGIIDLYSNSDYLHGLLFARRYPEYKEFHCDIDGVFGKIAKIIKRTSYTNFIRLRKNYVPIPVFRPLDIGMYPEMLYEHGEVDIAETIIDSLARDIIVSGRPLGRCYLWKLLVNGKMYLMKDHTNILFSFLRIYRNNGIKNKEKQLKRLFDILLDKFTSGDIIYNNNMEKGVRSSSLAFAFLETLLEAYIYTEDRYYREKISVLLPFWLNIISDINILPSYKNINTGRYSDDAIVDNNTDFYVFLKKFMLFGGEHLVSDDFIGKFKSDIIKYYLDSSSHDVYSSVNIGTGEKSNVIKSKFSSLFTKVLISDNLISRKQYFDMEIFLDDR